MAGKTRRRMEVPVKPEYARKKHEGVCVYSRCLERAEPGRVLCLAHALENARRLKRGRYRLTHEELAALEAVAACVVCGSDERLCIDHDHVTGKVRGVLCGRCNTLLGLANDSTERLHNLAAYLRRNAHDAA